MKYICTKKTRIILISKDSTDCKMTKFHDKMVIGQPQPTTTLKNHHWHRDNTWTDRKRWRGRTIGARAGGRTAPGGGGAAAPRPLRPLFLKKFFKRSKYNILLGKNLFVLNAKIIKCVIEFDLLFWWYTSTLLIHSLFFGQHSGTHPMVQGWTAHRTLNESTKKILQTAQNFT